MRKDKKNLLFLVNRFVILMRQQQTNGGLSPSICSSNTNSTHTYLCLLSAALRQGTRSRRQEYWLENAFYWKVFLITARNYFLWRLIIQEVIAFLVNNSLFLYSICELGLVFLQTSFLPSHACGCSFLTNRFTLSPLEHNCYSSRLLLCSVDCQ